jgi:hypothetical protein
MDEKELANLGQKYRLDVVLSRPELPVFPIVISTGKIHGKEADRKNIESYWPLLWSEWNLYPPELVEKAALKRIILCEDLAFENAAHVTQLRTALPDYEHHDLYLDVQRGRENTLYVCEVIHHEFFHIIDWCADQDKDEDGWIALNPPGFTYLEGGETQQKNPHTSELSDNPGFLNEYSTSGLIEDKAEIFAHMVMDRKRVEQRGMTDGIIKGKMQKMQELLRRFCPQLDAQFWNMAGQVKRPGIA